MQRARVPGTDVGDEGVPICDVGIALQQAHRGLVDEAGHVAVIDEFHAHIPRDLHAVQEDFVVRRLGEDVCGEAAQVGIRHGVLTQGLAEVAQDGGGLFHDGAGDGAGAEDIARERQRLFQVVELGEGAVRRLLRHEQGHGGRAELDDRGGIELVR